MSYDIGLYDRAFLRKAIDEDLGDYRVAPPFSPDMIAEIKSRLLNMGYLIEADNDHCTEYIHPNGAWGLQVTVFKTEITFSVPYWDDADAAVAHAKADARRLADEFCLGLTDQQNGELIC